MHALNDDLNTPQALAVMWDLLKSDYPPAAKKASLLKFDEIFGLNLASAKPIDVPDTIRELVSRREQLRTDKQYDEADTLRDEIAAAGFIVEDTPAGSVLKKLKS